MLAVNPISNQYILLYVLVCRLNLDMIFVCFNQIMFKGLVS